MAWRRPGDKPLSETMMVGLLTHICVTLPQWVNDAIHHHRNWSCWLADHLAPKYMEAVMQFSGSATKMHLFSVTLKMISTKIHESMLWETSLFLWSDFWYFLFVLKCLWLYCCIYISIYIFIWILNKNDFLHFAVFWIFHDLFGFQFTEMTMRPFWMKHT